MRKLGVLISPLPLLASACAVGPAYKRPSTPPPAAGPFITESDSFDATNALPDDWWRLYKDPALDELVTRALTANTDLRIASANLARARAILQESRAGRMPSTDISGGVSYGDGTMGSAGQSAMIGDEAQWSQNGSAGLSWEVDLFGRIGRAIEAARADAEAVAAARDAVRVTVAAETTRAYLNACAAAYALSVAKQSYTVATQTLQLVTAQERAGSAGKLDVERAGAAAATARAAIPTLEGQRQIALFELAALLGTTPDNVPETARVCSVVPEPVSAIPIGDGADLLRRRPDLRQAERQLAADTARIGVAMGDLYPKISFGASGNFFRNDLVKGSDSFSFSLGPLLSWRFPNMSVARARVRQAEAQGEASLAAFDGKVLTALKEVEQALTNVSKEQERLDALREATERSERAFGIAEQRYHAGSAAYLDVLVAQADLLSARAAYASSLQRLSSARVDLLAALGGGWATSTQSEPTQPMS